MKTVKDLKYGSYNENLLDLYIPDNDNFKVIVYFHGGGFEGGSKNDFGYVDLSTEFCKNGYAVANVNYRLYPNASFPDYIEDGAKAVKYVIDNIKSYGKCDGIMISGQSAGAYLSMMLCADEHYLKDVNVDKKAIDCWLIDSAQQFTHFNVLKERGVDPRLECIDSSAPIFFINKDFSFSRMLLIFYEQDITCRKEENLLFYSTVKNFNKDADIEYRLLSGGHCHGSTVRENGMYPYITECLKFIEKQI